ncbi:unnamed protein product [Effrenium voratum]|uniref:Methyltransferase FkbM domain-containing protein n=1 Tax=Effrenium voratum TaxID=2562239 RepID=A0AA36MM64_9DINO|nr:unnamed protein product [Effrenium voratum]
MSMDTCRLWHLYFAALLELTASFRACPPPNMGCVADVRGEASWSLWAEVDKALSQRTYELLTLYEWIPKEDTTSRATALRGLQAMEAAKQLLCASTFARCDVEGVAYASALLNASPAKTDAAELAIQTCGFPERGSKWLGRCSYAVWDWADAEYLMSAQGFMHSGQAQLAEEADRLNSKKTDADAGYSAAVYPALFSPEEICALSMTPLPSQYAGFGLQPVFSGEAFQDVSWVDISNLRTRHLSAISLLETLENGAAFQDRHPQGLSRIAVNLGGGDGACRVGHGLDPVNCFFPQGFGGVVFEANKSLESELQISIGKHFPQVQVVMEAAAEDTISQRLEQALAKRPGRLVQRDEIDIIKVDVDGPDCHLVRGLVRAGWQPKVWHVEVNPLFPPGISVWPTGTSLDSETTVTIEGLSSAFSRRVNDKQALVGCSLQALLDVAGPDYVLTHMEFENAVLVRRDISEGLEPWLSSRSPVQKWRDGYFCHPIARVRLPHDNDQDSLFLHYDFRRWGDPRLDPGELHKLVKEFLAGFVQEDTYSLTEPPRPTLLDVPTKTLKNQAVDEDINCEATWKGHVFQWPIVLRNIERLLSAWATGSGDVEAVLMALVEDFANQLNIDRAWPIFKSVASGECPVGGLAIGIAMRWRCLSPFWEDNPVFPATANLFAAMRRQLPLILRNKSHGHQSRFAAPLGCEHVLMRFIQAGLRRDLGAVLGSRWPIFELLSSMHTQSEKWPRDYP